MGQIDAEVAGGATLKDAVKTAGISDQTYYMWKKAATQPVEAAPQPAIAQAVAREVESEIGFPSPAPTKASASETNPDVVASDAQDAIDQDRNVEFVAPEVELDTPEPIDDSGTIVGMPDATDPTPGETEQEPKASRKRASRNVILPEPARKPSAPWQMRSLDELESLEAENRALKRLMISRLRAENDQLKDKLRRFAADI